MRVGIDASNLRGGGGITHLRQLLSASDPELDGFSKVVVWGSRQALEALPPRVDWLERVHIPMLEQALPMRMLWRQVYLEKEARVNSDILLIPGGLGGFKGVPWVTMCRNMLPFEPTEKRRYGISSARLRLELLQRVQARSFVNANGVIFLTDYAKSTIQKLLPEKPKSAVIIPHGVDKRFAMEPRPPRRVEDCSQANPFSVLYVSTVNLYKHQWNVVNAVAELRARGIPVTLDIIGSGTDPALRMMMDAINSSDPKQLYIRYHGKIPFETLHSYYHRADLFVYASTCENLPNILLEAMAAGLAIASSKYGPMPEVLGHSDASFNPEDTSDIIRTLENLIRDTKRRKELAYQAYERAKIYTWEACARDTFAYLRAVLGKFRDDSINL